jgi:protein TonB
MEMAAALDAEATRAEAAARAEAARKIAASVVADRAAAAAKREREDLVRAPRPVIIPVTPPQPRSLSRSMLLTVAAVAIMGVVGFAQRDYLLGIIKPAPMAPEVKPAQPAPLDEALLSRALKAAMPQNATAPPPSVQAHVSRSALKTPDTSDASNPQPESKSPDTPDPSAFAPAASSSAPIEGTRSAEATAPLGRLFEPNDVDVSPTVARRIEPQLPADLKSRPVNETVIVRVLVSQTGDPSRVSLLRKSKQGRSLDDAVVAAVTQWRFSPAKRRGEPVSSWYNIGVPLGHDN